MITVALLLLLAAFVLALAAVFRVVDRYDLTAIAVLLVIIYLVVGNVH
jgi:hypothetical protein